MAASSRDAALEGKTWTLLWWEGRGSTVVKCGAELKATFLSLDESEKSVSHLSHIAYQEPMPGSRREGALLSLTAGCTSTVARYKLVGNPCVCVHVCVRMHVCVLYALTQNSHLHLIIKSQTRVIIHVRNVSASPDRDKAVLLSKDYKMAHLGFTEALVRCYGTLMSVSSFTPIRKYRLLSAVVYKTCSF
jgi:hypothetical protein